MGAQSGALGPAAILIWVAGGAALGGVLRHAVTTVCARGFGAAFPWGTLLVNVSGCLFAGLLLAGAARHPDLDQAEIWFFGAVGLVGSYTTVSSFSLQTLELARRGAWARAAVYVAVSVALCLTAAWGGFVFAATLIPATTP